jgi:hypothetical protein
MPPAETLSRIRVAFKQRRGHENELITSMRMYALAPAVPVLINEWEKAP